MAESQVPPRFASHMILTAAREGTLRLSANPCKQMPAYDGVGRMGGTLRQKTNNKKSKRCDARFCFSQ